MEGWVGFGWLYALAVRKATKYATSQWNESAVILSAFENRLRAMETDPAVEQNKNIKMVRESVESVQ